MDSDNDSYHFPKCQTHAYRTRFENGCSENSTQKLLTKYSTEENNKHVICRPRSVRIAASGRTQDLWHSFSQYGPPGRQMIYKYLTRLDFTSLTSILFSSAKRTFINGVFILLIFFIAPGWILFARLE